ncbi:MAG: hypothetical protein IJ197_07770 [Bacteroidaceae bacterium]|nr:hypothetical protein [Bacteroidaceae bacterium]
MKQAIFTLLLAAVALTACHRQTFEEQVVEDINHFNQKESPKRMDMFTTLDSMSYDPALQLISYYYTVEGEADCDILSAESIESVLLENLRSSIPLKAYKEHGMRFHYVYLSRLTGKPRVECTFTPEDYQ